MATNTNTATDLLAVELDKHAAADLLGVNARRATTRRLRRELPWRVGSNGELRVTLGAVLQRAMLRQVRR